MIPFGLSESFDRDYVFAVMVAYRMAEDAPARFMKFVEDEGMEMFEW